MPLTVDRTPIQRAVAKFPSTFHLIDTWDATFRINPDKSYWDNNGVIKLQVEVVENTNNDEWRPFCFYTVMGLASRLEVEP